MTDDTFTGSTPDTGDAETTALLLARADHEVVQRQNLHWLSRRFGFAHLLPDRLRVGDGKTLGLEESPLAHLPKWRRWPLLVQRALFGRDPAARDRIKASLGFRLFRRPPVEVVLQPLLGLDSDAIDEDTYRTWVERYDALGAADLVLLERAVRTAPRVLVVLRITARDVAAAAERIGQFTRQLHRHWRALILLDGLAGEDAARLRAAALQEPRLAVIDRWPDPDGFGPEPFVIALDPDVVLRPETLLVLAEAAQRSGARLVYADEDRIDEAGMRHAPLFKPSFSPELNRRMPYLGALVCVEAALAAAHPLDRPVERWAQALADTLAPETVHRIPRVLFHRPDGDAPDDAPDDAHDAAPVAAALPWPSSAPSVDIVIPTRNLDTLLSACLESIWQRTDYPADKLHVVVVDNGSDEPATLALLERLRADPRATVIADPRPFNYARLNNVAARASGADILLFLNNDTEVSDPNWLSAMAGWAARADIGVVGPKLLYPDRSVQHGGVVLGIGGVAGHSFIGLAAGHAGYMGLADVTREVSALTGACIALRRSVFEAIGGFDERLDVAFNDTALCCEATRRGLRNLYLGETVVIHHESKSRGFDDTPEKIARFHQECLMVRGPYKAMFDDDPFYSPNLGLERQYQPAIPRLPRPWRHHRRAIGAHPRILILSDVHAVGHGVPVVIKEHAEHLAGLGWAVFVGGPMQANEIEYRGCHRVYLEGHLEAQSFAYQADVDCVIAHTIPYFWMFRTMGPFPYRVLFDHGEPPPAWFANRRDRENIDMEKQFCYRLADLVLTNTATVRDEIGYEKAEVAGLGNSHLAVWNPALALRRPSIRAALGLEGRLVVLNVCRFHRAERVYKGIDDYVALKARLEADDPALAARIAFVLCGKGEADDVAEMQAAGLTVFANVTDAALIDLYAAADLYANFSKWEGFNLGIAQALAMGLDVVASDIPAHRAFPIRTTNEVEARVRAVADCSRASPGRRAPVLLDWAPLLRRLSRRLSSLVDSRD